MTDCQQLEAEIHDPQAINNCIHIAVTTYVLTMVARVNVSKVQFLQFRGSTASGHIYIYILKATEMAVCYSKKRLEVGDCLTVFGRVPKCYGVSRISFS